MAVEGGAQDELLRCVLETVCASDRVVKKQQRGEPDLTKKEKFEVLKDLVHNSPGSFLMRYGSLLNWNELCYFNGFDEYEVLYRLKEFRKVLTSDRKEDHIRNRRYKAIEVLTTSSDYFTENEMRERRPSLYRQYIGRFLSEEERKRLIDDQDKFTMLAQLFDATKRMKGEEEEEEEEKDMMLSDNPLEAIQEKLIYRNEFIRLMHLSFLNGEDQDFDYNTVDNNIEYDDQTIRDRDFEDSYFDSEEPQGVSSPDGER